MRALLSQYHRYGRGKADVAVLHPESLSPRHLVPPAFVAYLAGAGLLSTLRPRTAAALVSPYVAAVAAASVSTARGLDPDARRHVPLAYLAMHLGWGSGFLARLPRAVAAFRATPQAGAAVEAPRQEEVA